MSDNYERSITPVPEVLNTLATVGFVLEQITSDLRAHTTEESREHHDMWSGVTKVDLKVVAADQKIAAIDKKVDRLYGGLGLLCALIVVLIPIIYFAFKGVVGDELDKRFPDMAAKRYQAQKAEDKATGQSPMYFEEAKIPWSVFPSAQAGGK